MSQPIPLLDVRSPAEFEQGHIPGAINVALFTNEERAFIGTTYKKEGKDKAVLEGLRIVGPKMASIVEQALEISPDRKLKVHCWRGGMRSGSVGWLLRQAGFTVEVLNGGYKAYRQKVLQELANPFNFVVVGGPTGSGKTHVLKALQESGEQVIDLERLANHKGSAFGALGEKAQPSIEQFENNLHEIITLMDANKRIWIEDESRKIGSVFIQDHLWLQMRNAPLINICLPISERVNFLVEEYGKFSNEELAGSILKIGKRLGGQNVKACLEWLDDGQYNLVAEATLNYYDKSYAHGQSQRDPNRIFTMHFDTLEPEMIAKMIVDFNEKDVLMC
jgi:tRNA 2-selenouridine synthase